jgi:hypothetical protein
MKKRLVIGLSISATVLAVGGVLAYRYYVPPSFSIISYNETSSTGLVQFDGIQRSFGNGLTDIIEGRSGWSVQYKQTPDGFIHFELFKKGKFIKKLGEI